MRDPDQEDAVEAAPSDAVPSIDSTRSARREQAGGRRLRVVLAAATITVMVLIVAGVIAGWALLYRAENPVAAGRKVSIQIASGASAAEVGSQLAKAGVVPNALMFRLKVRNSELAAKIRPGTYALATGMPYDLVLKKLSGGPEVTYYDVTIPEGYTVARIASRLSEQAGIPADEFLRLAQTGASEFAAAHPYLQGAAGGSLEGYLFPKTYRIKKGTSARAVIEMMLRQFDEEQASLDLTYAASKNLTLSDVVIIASILERETQLNHEYPLVASVIYNRLHARMRLQLDSTVFYGLPAGTKTLTKADLAEVTPYNTYRRYGLPAGPISNPGLAALQAAAHPAKSKYLYYVLTSKDGSQTFTTNYQDFLKAVAKYRKVFGIKG